MVGVQLDPAWPGREPMPAGQFRVDFEGIIRPTRLLRREAENPDLRGTSEWVRAASDACRPSLAAPTYVTADMQWRTQIHATKHTTSLFDALPGNLHAVVERLTAVAHHHRVVEDELAEELRALTDHSTDDGWDRHGSASAWTGRLVRGADLPRTPPPGRPMRGTVRLGVVDMPFGVLQPPTEIMPWLRDLKQTMAWEPQFTLAGKWAMAAECVQRLRGALWITADELARAWSGEAASLAQEALRRIHATAGVLEGMSRVFESRTHHLAKRLREADDLRLRSWSNPDTDAREVAARIDASLQDYLRHHPRELPYDLPFTGAVETAWWSDQPPVWPVRDDPVPTSGQVPPVPGVAAAQLSRPSQDFWTGPVDSAVPPVIG